MKVARKLWILALLVLLVNQFNVYALYTTAADITGAATGQASLTIEGNEIAVVFPICNSTLTTEFGRWNYVSIPLELSDGAIKTELSSIAGKYDLVYEYNDSTGLFAYYYEPFDVGSLTFLEGGKCYLIKATSNTTTNFNGTSSIASISHDLVTDYGRWNYVGWVAEYTDLTLALSSIDGNYDLSYKYNTSTGLFAYYYAPFDVGTYNIVSPCDCQLIKATSPDTLTYSIS